MKKLKSSLTNMAIVLTVIAIVAGGVLAYVNKVTAPQIEKINADNLAAGIKEVIGDPNLIVAKTDTIYKEGTEKIAANIQFMVYSTTDKSGNSLGTAISTTENGFGGPLQVLVGFDNKGTILGYTVLSSSETPGLGAKAGTWFQKGEKGDIIGKNPGKDVFAVSKDVEGGIDAITASTITSRAFLLSIKNAYNMYFTTNTSANSGATPKSTDCPNK